MSSESKRILGAARNGSLPVDEALLKIKTEPFAYIGHTKGTCTARPVRAHRR